MKTHGLKAKHPIYLEEISQAKVRLGVCTLALFLMGCIHFFFNPLSLLPVAVLVAYSSFSALWLLLVIKDLGPAKCRRFLVLFADLGINTFFVNSLGESGTFLYPMYLWIIVGSGMRFGPNYLLFATAVGAAFFGNLLIFNSYWTQNPIGGLGLWAGLIVLPLFYITVVRRLRAANTQLTQALEESQMAIKAKSEFIANMSHELRTPMNGVMGISDLLRLTPMNNKQTKYLDLIQSSARSLLAIIDDVLDFSKVQAGKFQLHQAPMDLSDLMQKVHQILALQAQKKGLVLEWHIARDVPSFVKGDKTRIRQILNNLVGNAVKFTEDGFVRVKVTKKEREDDQIELCIVVEDSGIGIPEEKMGLVFSQFEQVDQRRSRRFAGTGLGLPISLNLARLMGGDITLESQVGVGSSFTVKLLLNHTKQCPKEETFDKVIPKATYPLRALVVEDNPVNQLITKVFLKRIGITGEIAQDGMAAQECFQKGLFDLVFMDNQLPGMDGLEVARWIRSHENKNSHIPIVALTASAGFEDRQACMEAGMDAFLTKPLTLDALQETISNLSQTGVLHSREPSMLHSISRSQCQDKQTQINIF